MSVETAKMSRRGQIIIPKEIREDIDASKDTIFVVSTIDKDTIIMKKMDTKALVKEFKRLEARTKKNKHPQKRMYNQPKIKKNL